MTATYTFDVFTSLDGFGSVSEGADWGGYWGKQGPELLAYRLGLFDTPQRMVFGADTFRLFAMLLSAPDGDPSFGDPWVTEMITSPATVVSSTLTDRLGWHDAQIVSGDAVDVVAALKAESDIPLRSHGSLSMNRALMTAGLVDYLQVTVFPVITGATGVEPVFGGAADFDLNLVEARTLDDDIQVLTYRPTPHDPS